MHFIQRSTLKPVKSLLDGGLDCHQNTMEFTFWYTFTRTSLLSFPTPTHIDAVITIPHIPCYTTIYKINSTFLLQLIILYLQQKRPPEETCRLRPLISGSLNPTQLAFGLGTLLMHPTIPLYFVLPKPVDIAIQGLILHCYSIPGLCGSFRIRLEVFIINVEVFFVKYVFI